MRYVSTRGGAPAAGFAEVLLAGLAPDGGLYVPESLPVWTAAELASWRGLPYPELAFRLMEPFVGDAFAPGEFRATIGEAYASFDAPAVTPLVPLSGGAHLLELHHGPTLAFKDVALQLLGRLIDSLLGREGRAVTLLGSTSGDTGSAIIHGCRGRRRIEIFVMHPLDRVSPVQRRQMTTVLDANVHNIALRGTFDDCQTMQKRLFADPAMSALSLTSGNSINWGRVLPQCVYYAQAWLSLGCPGAVDFVVPTGNFGDVYAGWLAKGMGVPVRRLVVATNENDILHRFGEDGVYRMTKLRATMSPSMDILVSSNFERLLWDLHGRDPAPVRAHMAALGAGGEFAVPAPVLSRFREHFGSGRASEAETLESLAGFHREHGFLIDPHTAVGWHVGRALGLGSDAPAVYLATAHPAKFAAPVQRATGLTPPVPAALEGILEKPERVEVLDNSIDAVRGFILERAEHRAR